MFFFWLILLGIFTYWIVKRSVASITRTPVWLLWLVMMMPAFIWTAWILLNGENAPMPLLLLIGPFVACPLLYWVLIQWGRPVQATPANSQGPSRELKPAPLEKRAALRPIDKDEEAALQTCFPWSIYYLQNIEYRPQALICRGQLRSSPEVAYKTIQENIEKHFRDRFLVVFQEGLNGKPFFALVPNPQAKTIRKPGVEQLARPGLAVGLLLATLLTTTLAGVLLAGVDETALQADLSLLLSGVPYALTLMAILGVHELAHYLTAKFHHVQATFPYFIPVPYTSIFPFGTLGAFIQVRSPVPNRKALFDVGIAGPLAGFVITVPILLWGLAHSAVVPLTEESGLLTFTSFRPSLFLLAVFSKLALGSEFGPDAALNLHPVAIAGCLGLLITALNLMPVGQLDGGHLVHAMFGQRTGAVIGQVARLLLLGLSFVQREFLLWAILLFFIPVVDEPALNDVSELDNRRDLLGLLALSLLVLIILPTPQLIAQLLF